MNGADASRPRSPLKQHSLGVLCKRGVPVRTVLDVGVLHGTPELIEAYPNLLHILFEPVIEFRDRIELNYAGIPHKLVPIAVSDRSGTTALGTTSIVAGRDISHSYMTGEEPEKSSRSVSMVSLDDYLRHNPSDPPYFLKIDIDGEEMKVLRGAQETLKQTAIVLIEATVDTLAERLSFLCEAGFRLFDLTEPCYYDDSLWQCDAVLLRRDIHVERFADIHCDFDESKWEIFGG